jgi:UDP-N-acetylglucosamine--N-acetylmuramyl-(pentapeptide) pyrophosphoryl-undecaprenol N-acetylglucosamine transferase
MLAFGGSQAVRRLADAVQDAVPDLVERCYVVHITGPTAIEEAHDLRDSLPEPRRERYRPFAFLHEDMDAAMTAADLLVGRAGSSTLAEAAAAALPMVVVPYPHAAAHQKANAAEMVEAGAAILVEDEHLDGGTLREACDLLFDVRLTEMSGAARSVARPGAAAAGAWLLEILAAGQPLPDQAELDRITRSASAA